MAIARSGARYLLSATPRRSRASIDRALGNARRLAFVEKDKDRHPTMSTMPAPKSRQNYAPITLRYDRLPIVRR